MPTMFFLALAIVTLAGMDLGVARDGREAVTLADLKLRAGPVQVTSS